MNGGESFQLFPKFNREPTAQFMRWGRLHGCKKGGDLNPAFRTHPVDHSLLDHVGNVSLREADTK